MASEKKRLLILQKRVKIRCIGATPLWAWSTRSTKGKAISERVKGITNDT